MAMRDSAADAGILCRDRRLARLLELELAVSMLQMDQQYKENSSTFTL